MTVFWPEVFKTGIIPDEMTKKDAIAAVLCAWGCSTVDKNYWGTPRCKNFGEVLVALRNKFKISVTPEGIIKEADKELLTRAGLGFYRQQGGDK